MSEQRLRRRDFLKKAILAGTGAVLTGGALILRRPNSTRSEATTSTPVPSALVAVPLVIGPQVRDGDPATTPWPPNVEVPLANLFPAGPTLVHPNPIDHAIATGKPFQVRPLDGGYIRATVPTPGWILERCNTVVVTNPQSGTTITKARTWEPEYQSIRSDLLRALAVYDGAIPLIFDTWGMDVFAEPFLRSLGDPASRESLRAAGYTADADRASQLAGLQAHTVFERTRIGFALNGYQVPKPDWSGFTTDMTFVASFCDQARTLFGQRACLGNNSIRSSYIGQQRSAGSLYGILEDQGPPLRFQTAVGDKLGDLHEVIDWAISMGAYAVELPPGYEALVTDSYLHQAKTRMAANAA
ncbi:MAG: hypothetical protein M3O98_02970 [Actinomycetota bacterium]|nr:hypothetical protein [Actinomycetota bacterium]